MEPDTLLAHVATARAGFPRDLRVGWFPGPDGRGFWLKQVERHRLRGWVTKGPARRSFENDRTALRTLSAAGLPVAPIVAEGPGYFVMPDLGPTLLAMMTDPATDPGVLRTAFVATGAALARLHCRGLCHGRPAVRDVCWDGAVARFIDFERFSPGRTGPAAFARDLLIFVWSAFSTGLECRDDVDAMIAAYRAAAPPGTEAALRALVRKLVRMRPAMALLCRLRPASREMRAAMATVDHAAAMVSRAV